MEDELGPWGLEFEVSGLGLGLRGLGNMGSRSLDLRVWISTCMFLSGIFKALLTHYLGIIGVQFPIPYYARQV